MLGPLLVNYGALLSPAARLVDVAGYIKSVFDGIA